jgi:hypothetical protein
MFNRTPCSRAMPEVSPFRRVWRFFMNQLVQDAPEADMLCEFDCRKEQCTVGEWQTCERRLRRAAGELMPGEPPRSSTHTEPRSASPKPDP